MSIPVFRPFIKRKDMDAVLTCLLSDQLGGGSEAKLLIDELRGLFGMGGGLALREYPRAIALALAALELPPGSRIGIGALAPRLWDEAIRAAGHRTVVADCSEHNPCISAAALRGLHAAEPLAAVVLGNELGFSADLPAIRELGLPVLADVTSLLGEGLGEGSPGEGGPVPAAADHGDILVLGLEASSPVTAGGGVVLLAGGGPAGRAWLANLQARGETLPPEVLLPDMNAALGRTQTRELAGFMERRRNLQELFRRAALRGRHRLLANPEGSLAQPYSFPLVIQSSVAEVQVYARKKNVETMHAFAGSIVAGLGEAEGFDARLLPHAFGLSLRCLLFPLYPGLSQREIDAIEKVVATLP